MELHMTTFLIVCPLVFLAGFVDAIGGGGGLISLPAYYLAGVPIHHAIATNKLSSATGTLISTIRIGKSVKIRWKLIAPAVVMALIGSYLGTRLSILTDEKILRQVLLIVLPVVAFFVLRKNSLISEKTERLEPKKEQLIVWTSALIIGTYDGFYGPGTGTFLLDHVHGAGTSDIHGVGCLYEDSESKLQCVFDGDILAGRAYPVTSGTDCIGVQHCRTLCGCWYGIKKWDESYPSHYSGSACTAVY